MSLQKSLRRLKTLDTSENLKKTYFSIKSVDSSLLKPGVLDIFSDNIKKSKPSRILLSTDAATINVSLSGGKGSSLAILNSIKGIEVPHFFCVTTEVFKNALSNLYIKPTLYELQELSTKYQNHQDQDTLNGVFVLAKKICKAIVDIPLEREIYDEIEFAYRNLCEQTNTIDLPVAVRSSATTEDLAEASFAGQHDTFLNQCGIKQVIESIRRCWASLYTDRAVEYRNRHQIPHSKAEMCVVIQQMVEPIVAGTSFSVEISTSFPAIHIAATYGLGEAVVSGEVTGDEWLLDPVTLRIIKQVIGSKEFEFKKIKNGSGVSKLLVDTEKRKRLCLSNTQVKQIAQATLQIKNVYKQLYGYRDIDTEFAIDANGDLKLLQSRPLVEVGINNIMTVDSKSEEKTDVLLKGAYSLLGAVHGKVKVIFDFEDIVNGSVHVEEDDILFTTKTGNYWNQYLTNLKGIVTIEGSPTAHPMLIGRERNLPVICGISGLGVLRQMAEFNGKWVTMDGLTKKIYMGKKKLKQASQDQLFEQFSTVSPAEPPPDEASLNFLKDFNRVHQDENSNWWVYNPNSKLNRVMQRIMIDMYPQRFKIVNSCRINKHVVDPFCSQVKIHDDKVCDKLDPIKETLCAWEGMSLQECQQYHNKCEEVCLQYLEICADFHKGATPEKWDKYISSHHELHAFMWMSYFWRVYLNMKATECASKLGVSQFHFNAMLAQIQDELFQEDELFRKEILEIALEIKPLLKGSSDSQLGNGSWPLLMVSLPQYQPRLERAARHYCIDKECDILRPLPVAMVFKKVLEALDQSTTFQTDVSGKVQQTFFPEEKDLHEWVMLLVASRVQHCNCHHWNYRGQYTIKKEFMKISEQEHVDLHLLFNKTPEEIRNFIQKVSQGPVMENTIKEDKWSDIRVGAVGFIVGFIVALIGQKIIKGK